MNRWRNKVAVVTGASSGIGAAIAESLVKEGLQVAGLARRSERVEELAKNLKSEKGRLYAIKADISKEEDTVKAFQWILDNIGPVHILVNNAGVIKPTSLVEGNTEMWKEIFDTNVLGLCVATREAVKIMKGNNIDGHIIHINSLSGHRVPPLSQMNVYPASKYAVTALTETLRQELNGLGSKIKVTSLSPGLVDTEIATANKQESIKDLFKNQPVLQSEDIADAALYVLSTPPHVQVHELRIRPTSQLH